MHIKWLQAALDNLEGEAEYIAQDSKTAAGQVVLHIMSAVNRLKDHPSLGRTGRVHGTRELIIADTPYIIPYRVRGNEVQILRVFHAARKWPKRF